MSNEKSTILEQFMDYKSNKPLALSLGSFLAASLGVSVAAAVDENTSEYFIADSLNDNVPTIASAHEEGGCGEDKGDDHDGDKGEGECGEGKCGDDHEEGECGEGKCGEDKEDSDDESDESSEE